MANRGSQKPLGATDSGLRLSDYPLGSRESRAAARAMLVARNADELRFEVRSIVDGSRVNLDGLADTIRAARMRDRNGNIPAPIPANEASQQTNRGGSADCLLERIRKARERVKRMQGPEAMP